MPESAVKNLHASQQGRMTIMKTLIAVLLLLVSSSLLAAKPDCFQNPDFPACRNNPPGLTGGNIASVPEPGTLTLIGLGMAGLVAAKRRKR